MVLEIIGGVVRVTAHRGVGVGVGVDTLCVWLRLLLMWYKSRICQSSWDLKEKYTLKPQSEVGWSRLSQATGPAWTLQP